ncbi:MAG: large conductance mechanosensitive channel protein MscL [Chloroflexota bacterium]
MIAEFKEFLVKTNALALAVGVIIGIALGTVVSSLVSDIIMPPIGVLLGGVDFSGLVITLKAASGDNPAVTINWGTFIQTVINFIVIAAVVFVIGKVMLKEAPAAPPVPAKHCPYCKQDNAVDASKCMHCASAI